MSPLNAVRGAVRSAWIFLLLWLSLAAPTAVAGQAGPAVGAGQESPPAVLTEIKHVVLADRIEFTILVEGKFHYSLTEMGGPKRLIIDLEPVEKRLPDTEKGIQAFGVLGYRLSQYRPLTTRVVFDLEENKPTYRVKPIGGGLTVVFIRAAGAAEAKPPAPAPTVAPPGAPTTAKPVGEGLGLPTTLLGVSVITYRLSDERFTEIFGSQTGWTAGFEILEILAPRSRVRPAIGFDYLRLSKAGESTISHTPTEISLAPFTVSGFLILEGRPFSPYLGAGLTFYQYKETSTLYDTSGSATGFALQAGLFIHFGRLNALKAKIFGRLVRAKVLQDELELRLGGSMLGLALLAGFNI
jgi:hypothetical protein